MRALAVVVVLVVALVLGGCAMPKPVLLEADDGGLEVTGIGRVWGKGLRYRSGLLQEGESAATFDGTASGYSPPAPPPEPAR